MMDYFFWEEALEQAKEEGYHNFNDQAIRAREILRERRKLEGSEKHKTYLKSVEWKNKRAIIMERDKGLCQDCLIFLPQIKKLFKNFIFDKNIILTKKAEQVHHKTYASLHTPKEIDDCISLCSVCHKIRHCETRAYFNILNELRKMKLLKIVHTNILKQEKIKEIILKQHDNFIKSITIKPEEFGG